MKSKKLGRGLDALLGEMDDAYESESSQKDTILELAIKDIRTNPFQPRKTFDESSLSELANSIKNDGLLQPIVVKEDIDGYILIAGERRFRASKLAKLKTIRAITISADESKMRQFALLENIQREELNSIELAFAYSELLKLHKLTHDELSNMIFKSRTHITNTIRLLQLSNNTQKALIDKKITAGHAKVLVGLADKQQQVMVNSIVGQKLSVREVEFMIKNMKDEKKSASNTKSTSPRYDFSELKDVFDYLGFKSKSSDNKITVEFDNENQIKDFLEYFQE